MFTGLVQNLGKLVETVKTEKGLELLVHSDLPEEHFAKGASIMVDGVCLTVEEYFPAKKNFLVTAVQETLDKSTLAQFEEGRSVNLEAALTLSTPLGGHLVSGHVDAVGTVVQSGEDFVVKVPKVLLKFFAVKGSIVVNGVSLTLADQKKDTVRIALIPETLKMTNLGLLKKGDEVNLEVDLIARYLDRLLTARA